MRDHDCESATVTPRPATSTVKPSSKRRLNTGRWTSLWLMLPLLVVIAIPVGSHLLAGSKQAMVVDEHGCVSIVSDFYQEEFTTLAGTEPDLSSESARLRLKAKLHSESRAKRTYQVDTRAKEAAQRCFPMCQLLAKAKANERDHVIARLLDCYAQVRPQASLDGVRNASPNSQPAAPSASVAAPNTSSAPTGPSSQSTVVAAIGPTARKLEETTSKKASRNPIRTSKRAKTPASIADGKDSAPPPAASVAVEKPCQDVIATPESHEPGRDLQDLRATAKSLCKEQQKSSSRWNVDYMGTTWGCECITGER